MPWFGVLLLLALAPDDVADALKLLDAHQPDQAEPLLRKAIEAEPADVSAHFNLALALSLQHKDPEAVAEYRKTLELKPGLYQADLNLGLLLLRDKQPAEAVPVLKEASEARPQEKRTALYYAQALLDSGDIPAAAERFQALNDKNGLLQVAGALEKSGDIPGAIAVYKQFPDDPAVRERLGQLQLDNDAAAAAIPNLEDAVRKAPTTANRLALADAYRLAKQPSKMLGQLQQAAAADPNNFDLRMAYGRALRDNRLLIPAAEQFNAAAKLRPDAVQAWNELASALIVSERYSEGLYALDRIRVLGKEAPGDYFLRAITLDKLKQRKEAIAAYRQFLAADGGQHADQEFQARQRIRIIENEMRK
jgi:tetratricopeptide (TPR) repeat protein